MEKEPFIDAETKKPVTVKNLIVQYVKDYPLPNEIKGRRMLVMTGKGKAEFFIGGKYIKGTWERKDLKAQTVYRDGNGSEIVLRSGNTWIEVHPNTKAVKVEYEKL